MMSQLVILRSGSHTMQDVEQLRTSHNIWREIDIYTEQCKELFEIQNPTLLGTDNFEEKQEEFLKKRLEVDKGNFVGNWIYFPWNGHFVHTLEEDELFVLTTNRNKNLVTNEEQNKLREASVAIVGLSVGSNVASALVYSGIAGTMRLAEYDILETSNLNRIRARFDQVGQSKLSVLAQQLYEVNPYLTLDTYPEGLLNEKDLEQFVQGSPKPSVIFEIIDSFETKIHLRQLAREHGIPVVMVTNLGDSAILDIERYDLHKDLPFFNGRAGTVPTDILKNPDITDADKHKYAVDLAGVEHIPQRALDSVAEIGKTLVGRPQLRSTVGVAGALCAYITRNIILDQELVDGSWHIKFSDLFAQETKLPDKSV